MAIVILLKQNLWNNSGKELSITVENGKLQFKNK